MKRIFTIISITALSVIGAKNTEAQCVDEVQLYDTKLTAAGGATRTDVVGGTGIPWGSDAIGEFMYGLKGTKLHGIKFDGRSLTGATVNVDVAVYSITNMMILSVGAKLGSATVAVGPTSATYEGTFATPILLEDGMKDFMFVVDASALSASDSIELESIDAPGANRLSKGRFASNWPSSQSFDFMISVRPIIEYPIDPIISSSALDTCVNEMVDFNYDNKPDMWTRSYFTNDKYNVNRNTSHFEWTFGDGSNDVANMDASHTYNTAGTYEVKLSTYFEGYTAVCTDSAKITVEVMDPAVADFNLPDNSSLIADFTSNSTDATSWSWDFGDGNTDMTENPTNTYPANSTYDITLIAGNAECENDTITKTMVFSVGMEDMEINGNVTIYPNPVEGALNFSFKGGLEKEATIEVYNILGSKVAVETIQVGTTTLSINTANLERGKYLVRFVNEEAHFTTTFVKQ